MHVAWSNSHELYHMDEKIIFKTSLKSESESELGMKYLI